VQIARLDMRRGEHLSTALLATGTDTTPRLSPQITIRRCSLGRVVGLVRVYQPPGFPDFTQSVLVAWVAVEQGGRFPLAFGASSDSPTLTSSSP
jgi:hypothetical protein